MYSQSVYTTFLINFLIIFSYEVHAQEGKNPHFGIKGGLNYSGFRRNPDLKFGWNAGIVGKKYVGDLGWFVQAEVLYSREGNLNQPLELINIPILFGFDFSDDFNAQLGYQNGFVIGTFGDATTQYKTYNPVLSFGFEFYTFKFSNFGARFNYGLSDIQEGINTSITYTFEVYFIAWIKN